MAEARERAAWHEGMDRRNTELSERLQVYLFCADSHKGSPCYLAINDIAVLHALLLLVIQDMAFLNIHHEPVF